MAEEGVKKKKKCLPSQGRVDVKDRISDLPDSLIHHILSFLETKDVIRTCMLARRWRYLWTSVPVLDFGKWMPFDLDVAPFISLTLMRYEGRKIRGFCVDLYDKVDECHIDSWIRFAVRHDVEELNIQFCNESPLYKFSRHLLECVALRVLKLGNCVLNLSGPFCFRSPTELHLRCVRFTDLDTSGCPLLEKLIMENCSDSLNIYAPNEKLRYLKDKCKFGHPRNSSLTLYAPYLLSIELGCDFRRSYSFTNLSSIESGRLAFPSKTLYRPNSDNVQLLVELLKRLSHAKTLKLCRWCVEILAHRETNNLKVPLLSATCLELKTTLDKYILPGISSLLSSSCCLEALVIKIKYPWIHSHDNYIDEIKSLELLELSISDLQLKTVMIHDFLLSERDWISHRPIASLDIDKFLENLEGEMKLVKLLLKNCKVLDRMIIRTSEIPSPSLKSKVLLGLAKKLLVLPRASTNAEIHFS